MPEILKNRNNQVCQRLDRYCEECAKIGSTDCIDHGGPPSEDSSVLGKRWGSDAFEDFMQGWGRDDFKGGLLKPMSKRPSNPASSKVFGNDRDNFPVPFPKPIPPTRPASSSYGIPCPAPAKLVSPSMPAPPSFAVECRPKFVSPIKPAASVPGSGPAVAVPNTEAATLPHDANTPSEHCRYRSWGHIHSKPSLVSCGLGVWFGVSHVVRYVSDDFGM